MIKISSLDYAYLGMRQAKKNNIPFVYYLLDHLHTLLPGEFKRSIAKPIDFFLKAYSKNWIF